MSANRLTFTDLDKLKRELQSLPAELVGEGTAIVTDAANAAKADVAAGYIGHRYSGHLADGLELVTRDTDGKSVGLVLRNKAKDASLFEIGTQVRHTNRGANRGEMPAAKIFIPAVQRRRREMYKALEALLERKGLTVTGSEP